MWEVLDAGETGGRAGQNHWLAQWMQKKSYKVEFLAQPDVKSMTGWIVREAKAQGGEFAREAADLRSVRAMPPLRPMATAAGSSTSTAYRSPVACRSASF
jgi:hypothetical protein